jgi:hypothetical protein
VIRVAARERDVGVAIGWGGQMRLARAEYTQLTPGGALVEARSNTTTGQDGQLIWFEDRELDAAAAIALPPYAELPARTSLPFVIAVAFGVSLDGAIREAITLAGEGAVLLGEEVRARRAWWQGIGRDGDGDGAVRRGVTYALDCAASRVDDLAVAVLADHEILPLVWTRDAYYVCRLLLALTPRDERARRSAALPVPLARGSRAAHEGHGAAGAVRAAAGRDPAGAAGTTHQLWAHRDRRDPR